jgi:hypothetical protein
MCPHFALFVNFHLGPANAGTPEKAQIEAAETLARISHEHCVNFLKVFSL